MKTVAFTFFLLISSLVISQGNRSFDLWEGDTINLLDENGLKQGYWMDFHETGALKKRTFYVNNVEHGNEAGFYKNGQVRYTIIWNQGKPHGFYQIYFASGRIKLTGVWRNDKNVGNRVEYYESGTVKHRETYNSQGELEGAKIGYFKNEIIQSVEIYEHGKLSGFSLQFDSLGNSLGHEKYKDGERVNESVHSDELQGILDYVVDQNKLIFVRDSLRTQQIQLEISEVESKAQIAENKSELERKEQRAYFLYGGVGLLFIFGIFMYNRFRVTSKQKVIIEKQKEEVDEQKALIEESHKEITDSIAYAKRIQSAILPPNSQVNELLSNSFILYKPKDVVAGDFYWLEESNGKVLFAAADCTGHGVPGAMVSVICNGALNRSVREYGLTEPGKILDKARDIVIQEFEKSDEEVKDGMDVALCSLEENNLQYAGAHNPLWIVRENEIIETKADKQPIGKYDNLKPYTTHSFELQKDDTIYIFSDGYVDQFGGEKGKKFKSKALRELLLSIQDKSMKEQKNLIDEAFETWRGEHEQIDDVCLIGVRV
jgi:serine phosphatase RsbU (regulator of sigma subunit)